MNKKVQPAWQAALHAAVKETDPDLIDARIQAAEAAIGNRIGTALRGPGFAEELTKHHRLTSLARHTGIAATGLRLMRSAWFLFTR